MKLLAVSAISLGVMGATVVPASASATTMPKSIRGNFYAYQGHHKWTKLSISAHKASIKYPGEKIFKLTPKAKNKAHRLSYKKSNGFFTLNSKNKNAASSLFPEGDMKLASRKIGKKHYKVIRGYQGGYRFDFIKGKKVAHYYSHIAD
ncbi:hypothetical protein FD13_GL001294 [Levilactobacillus senmaizukei DSM 21775 = NBRC 103853]|uniref:Uncharacterized protein n=2 Tax=Levilactobacillus senmaizukei TaxID=431273 RepID=A0A0R2DG26_9LACO|nr:hypothetical protein FD13_GL001294 [Levilactobacillus senmaizukei DSM 21775 = NBRC 103853]